MISLFRRLGAIVALSSIMMITGSGIARAEVITVAIIGLGEEGCGVVNGLYSPDSGLCYKRIKV